MRYSFEFPSQVFPLRFRSARRIQFSVSAVNVPRTGSLAASGGIDCGTTGLDQSVSPVLRAYYVGQFRDCKSALRPRAIRRRWF